METNPISKIAEPFTRLFAIICGYLILFLSFLVCSEIFLRKLLAVSLPGVDDFGGYVLAATAVFGATYGLITRSHSRVDLFLRRFPQAMQRICNTGAMVAFALVAGWAAWRASVVLEESVEFQSRATNPLQTPLWIPQSVWFFGLCLLALVSGAYALHAFWLCIKGSRKVNEYYGSFDQAREAEEQATRLVGIEEKETGNA